MEHDRKTQIPYLCYTSLHFFFNFTWFYFRIDNYFYTKFKPTIESASGRCMSEQLAAELEKDRAGLGYMG